MEVLTNMATTTDYTNILGGLTNLLGTTYAANQYADTANTAAQMAQFRPVGVTTRFGSSGFNYDPTTGQLTSAGYQVAPDVAAMREGMLGMAGTGMAQAQAAQARQAQIDAASQNLFNLGQGYLAQTPQQAAQNYMTQQQQLMAPGREQQLAQLTNQQQQQGRLGLGVGGTQAGYTAGGTGLAATNPQMAAYYNAMAQQDATLAANADIAARNQITFGQGLLGGSIDLTNKGFGMQTSAMAPYQQALTNAQTAENLGQGAFTLGTGLGSNAASSAQQAAQMYQSGANIGNAAISGGVSQLADPVARLIAGLIG